MWLYPPDLRSGRRGITSHANVSLAFRRSDHMDPGPNFPVERYLRLVGRELGEARLDGVELKPPPPTLRHGARGWRVKRLQRLLQQHGCDPGPIDGVFGARTEAAVREFQRRSGLAADGIVGPLTWRALEAA